MINRLDQLAEILQQTDWASAQTLVLPIEGSEKQALALRVEADKALAAWTCLRDKLPETGRWPVLITCWGQAGSWEASLIDENLFARWSFEQDAWRLPEQSTAPDDIIQQALSLELTTELTRLAEQVGFADEPEDSPVDPAEGNEHDLLHLAWFEPQSQHLALLLLPTADGWQTPAYLSWFGSQNAHSALTVAMLKHWSKRWGAELVAHFGTMLQLQVSRRPESASDALELAREQMILAPCTLDLPGVSLNEHARALMKTNRWFLHERP